MHPTVRRSPLGWINRTLCLLLIVAPGTWPGATGQQQQRPRRAVGKEQTAPPPPAPAASSPTAGGEELDDGETVRVETQLISVPVSVTDAAGRPVSKLSAADFKIYEDNQAQQITNFTTTDVPFEVALLLDTSGSTRADVALIRRAAFAFLDKLRAGDRVSVLAFRSATDASAAADIADIGAAPPTMAAVEVKTALTEDRDQLRRAVEELGASNGTPFYDSLLRAADEVYREPPRKEIVGRRALVALTDGVDSTSDADYQQARQALAAKGIACYFIQIDTEDFVEERLLRDCEADGTLTLSRAQLRRYRQLFAPQSDSADYRNFCELGMFQRMQVSRQLYQLARREMSELARTSGGVVALARDLRDAQRAFAEVASRLGTQFSLGYYPTNKTRDGRYRMIRVEVKQSAGAAAGGVVSGPLKANAREGYYAPKG